MLYQLPDGRTVEISIHDYLDFTDDELKSLIGYPSVGDYVNNPLYGSAITKTSKRSSSDDTLPSHKDVSDIPTSEKIKDQDYQPDDE